LFGLIIGSTTPLKLPLGQKLPHHALPKEKENTIGPNIHTMAKIINNGDIQPNNRTSATSIHENLCI
jgi:hypothetical protein